MPCRDYGDDDHTGYNNDAEIERYQMRNDQLARIACTVMDALEELGKEDFVLLKNKEVRDWWGEHKKADLEDAKRKVKALKDEQKAFAIQQKNLADVQMAQKEALEAAEAELERMKGRK